jgi:putative oxidoreductase
LDDKEQQEKGSIIMSAKISKRILSGFSIVVRVGLGCMFIYSSLPKIRQPYDFLSDIYSYELVGPKLGMLTAMVIPWAELLVGICLVGGIFISGALLMSIGLGAMFSFVLGWALHMSLNISCGCFGSSDTEVISYMTFLRAIIIMLLSVIAFFITVLTHPEAISNHNQAARINERINFPL